MINHHVKMIYFVFLTHYALIFFKTTRKINMPIAKARILCGNTTLFPWKIINIEEKLTIQGLFEYINS